VTVAMPASIATSKMSFITLLHAAALFSDLPLS
jgi:hypothetical protein